MVRAVACYRGQRLPCLGWLMVLGAGGLGPVLGWGSDTTDYRLYGERGREGGWDRVGGCLQFRKMPVLGAAFVLEDAGCTSRSSCGWLWLAESFDVVAGVETVELLRSWGEAL